MAKVEGREHEKSQLQTSSDVGLLPLHNRGAAWGRADGGRPAGGAHELTWNIAHLTLGKSFSFLDKLLHLSLISWAVRPFVLDDDGIAPCVDFERGGGDCLR